MTFLPLFPLSLGGFDFLHASGAVGAVFPPVGFGEGTPQQVSREGQNRRIADFGNRRGREFFLSLPTTPAKAKMAKILEIFSLFLNTDKFQKCQTHNKKAANLFQTYCFRWPLVAAGIQFFAYRSKRNLNSAAISCCFTYSSTSAFT